MAFPDQPTARSGDPAARANAHRDTYLAHVIPALDSVLFPGERGSPLTIGGKMESKRLAIIALISAALAMPLGGFVFGFMHCDDCGLNILGRGFIGLVFAVLTPLSGGFPPQNEGGVGAPFNAWPHIAITWALMAAFLVYRAKKKAGRREPIQQPQQQRP